MRSFKTDSFCQCDTFVVEYFHFCLLVGYTVRLFTFLSYLNSCVNFEMLNKIFQREEEDEKSEKYSCR